MTNICTLGHSSRPFEDFLNLLRMHRVEAVADVRSIPKSQRHPQYDGKELERALRKKRIHYVFLGKELGARRDERQVYSEGVAVYEHIAALPIFAKGIDRLIDGSRRMKIALMCAERDPLQCHRTILVCRNLPEQLRNGIVHILDSSQTESHIEVEKRLVREERLSERQEELFGGDSDSALERAYKLRGQRIAWQEGENEDIHNRVHKEVS